MLSEYQRAAMMPNPHGTAWFHHVQARYFGAFSQNRVEMRLSLEIREFSGIGGSHAEFIGLLELGARDSLPLVAEVRGALELESRDIRFAPIESDGSPRNYSGRFSENGRVLVLGWSSSDERMRQVEMVHEPTLHEMFAD